MEVLKQDWERDVVCHWCRSELRVVLQDLRKSQREKTLYVFKCRVCRRSSAMLEDQLPTYIESVLVLSALGCQDFYPDCKMVSEVEPTEMPPGGVSREVI
jgi:hypothetical protein